MAAARGSDPRSPLRAPLQTTRSYFTLRVIFVGDSFYLKRTP